MSAEKKKARAFEGASHWVYTSETFYQELTPRKSKSLVSYETLHSAARKNILSEMKRLLSLGTDVNERDRFLCTPLHSAAIYNENKSHLKSIDLLLKNGADVNAQDEILRNTPIQFLINTADVDVIKLLLEFGADVNIRNNNYKIPLFDAITRGEIEIVKLLLDHGSIVELKNKDGLSPLAIAATCDRNGSHFEICQLLLKNGADVNAKLKDGNTPCHHLVSSADLKTVEFFLGLKAEVNVRNQNGEIPLFEAIRHNNEKVVQLLFDRGSDVNAVNTKLGSTLLHVACESRYSFEVIKSLFRKGLDVNALDFEGRAPLIQFWMFSSNPASVTLLLKYTDFSIVDVSGNNTLCDYNVEGIWKIILEHIAKLQALNLSLHPSILHAISNNKEKKSYFEKCTKELSKAKDIKLPECWVTFFNVLVDSKRKLKNYASNDDLVKQFENSDFKNKFPIYGASMEKKMAKGMRMGKFFDDSAEILSDFLPCFNPTHLVIRNILECLSTKEFSKFCQKN